MTVLLITPEHLPIRPFIQRRYPSSLTLNFQTLSYNGFNNYPPGHLNVIPTTYFHHGKENKYNKRLLV